MDDKTARPAPPALLTREQILGRTALASEVVKVPEWSGTVRVRELTGAERDSFEGDIVNINSKGDTSLTMDNARARLVASSVIDEHGRKVFTPKDVEALGQLSAAALSRVFDVAARLSKISNADIEELAKN